MFPFWPLFRRRPQQEVFSGTESEYRRFSVYPKAARPAGVLNPGHPAGRKTHGEAAADARCARDFELRLVAIQRVLDDGEAEAGAAGIARAAAVLSLIHISQTAAFLDPGK